MSTPKNRKDLMTALENAMRDVSGAGVLFSQAVAQRLGINSTDLESLGTLMDGPKTAGQLAEATGLTTGAITGVVDRLEKAGFARREPDEEDRRKVLVRATPLLMQKAGPLYEPMRKATAQMLAQYGDVELALLLQFLNRAHEASITVIAAMRQPAKGKRKA